MSGLRILELMDPRWVKVAARQPSVTSFHHPDWASLIADCHGFRTFAVATSDTTGEIRAESLVDGTLGVRPGPAPVTDGMAGHLLASVNRHGPQVPCRTAGEALYRHAA